MIRRALFIGLVLLALAGCGGDGATQPPSVAPDTGEPVSLTITAENIEFRPASLTVPAGHPLQVTLDNKDAGVPHSLVLRVGPDSPTTLFDSDIVTGPATLEASIPGLVPGVFQFTCKVHPNMTASLSVEP